MKKNTSWLQGFLLLLTCTLPVNSFSIIPDTVDTTSYETVVAHLQQLVFSPMLLTPKEQTQYQHVLLELKTCDEQKLAQVFSDMKKNYLKLDLLTLGLDQTDAAFINNALSQQELQQIFLKICCSQAKIPAQTIIQKAGYQVTLDNNFFDDNELFCDNYLEFITKYTQNRYSPDIKILQELIVMCNTLLGHLKTKQPDTHNILAFFIAKLLIIRQELEFSCLLNLKPDMTNLLFKHHALITTRLFSQLQDKNPDIASQYLAIINIYTAQKTHGTSLAFKAQTAKNNIQELAGQYRSGFITGLLMGQNKFVALLDQMSEMLDSVYNAITKPANPLYQAIFNSLTPGQAGWSILAQSSPFLLERIVKLVQPYLAPNLADQANMVMGQNSHEKVLEFVTKNPEVFNELKQRHPEMLNLVALSFERMVLGSAQ